MTRDVYMCPKKTHFYHCAAVQKREVNLMTVARKYLLNNGKYTADYFTKGSQPRRLAKLKWCLG